MARIIRKNDPQLAQLAPVLNSLKAFVVSQLRAAKADLSTATSAGTSWAVLGFHNDTSELTVTRANATDLATAVDLVNELRGVYVFHCGDALAHKAADAANLPAVAAARDLATAQALANDLKAKFNVHRASTAAHDAADSTNVVASADATNLATLLTLANEIKTRLNAHMASGVSAPSLRVVNA